MDRGKTLTGIRSALLKELQGDTSRLHFINTRLILTIGVNLNDITPSLDGDGSAVEAALTTLRKMGFLRGNGSGEANDG